MVVRIRNLQNQNDLADLITVIQAYNSGNPATSYVAELQLAPNDITYKGKFQRYTDLLEYEITSPAPPLNVGGGAVDVEAYWGQDQSGTNAYVVTTYIGSTISGVTYFDSPGGNDITGSINEPVRPLESAPLVANYVELSRAWLLLDSASAKGLAQAVDPADGTTVVGIDEDADGALCVYVGDDDIAATDSTRCFVTTQAPAPIADGSAGIPLDHKESVALGDSPDNPGGADNLSTAQFICETGKTGRLEVIYYEKQ